MKAKELKINKPFEKADFEIMTHVFLIAILLVLSLVFGIDHAPKREVLMETKESVQRVDVYSFPQEKVLLNNTDFVEALANVETEEAVPEKVVKKEPVKVIAPSFVVHGELRNDYCVGSIVDLSGLGFLYGDEKIAIDSCETTIPDTSAAGNYSLKVTYKGLTVEIPYGVVEYEAVLHGYEEAKTVLLKDYTLESTLEVPLRLGKMFTGWYRDEECTIPFVAAESGETLVNLYAGWGDFARFACDEAGYITAYTGGVGSITDGLLNLIAHPSCVGVRSNAFTGIEDIVTDIYIPANIVDIEAGAFDCLPYVFYIYVDPANPAYCSVDGVLYTKDMTTVVAHPQGR